MKKSVLPSLTICFGLILSIVQPVSAIDSSKGFAFTDKVVLAYYYIWYQEDYWLKTAAEGGRKEGLEGLHPLVGAYNSWDPTIIEKHMQQMNRALIDALAVSWWYDTKTNGLNDTLDIIFEKAVDHNLKITIDYEHGGASLATSSAARVSGRRNHWYVQTGRSTPQKINPANNTNATAVVKPSGNRSL